MTKRRLGKYEVTDRLGRGGMAEVHRGYHANLDRYVAIKVLHAFLADDPEFKNRFLKEAQNVARLKHPHIVQVYDFDFDPEGESYYMVMELIEGPTLKDRMSLLHNDGDLLDFKEIVRIVREAASALAYAHSRDMIHRDVKPANLMLDHDDRVVLTDFGIAKIVTGAQFTASGGMVGTPAYMAPEQGLGEAGDERSDLYSLGIIFYQLLTGTLPYDAEAPLAIILKHLNSPIPLVSETNPNYPPSVDDVVARMMAKEPEERYQSANDLIVDLDRLMDDEPVPSRAIAAIAPPDTEADLDTERADQPLMPAAGGQGGRPPRRRVPMWLVGGLLSVLLLGGGYLALLGGGVLPPGLAGVASPTTTETPTTTPTITLTATATMTATEAPSETPTATITPTITPTPSDTPTETHTPTHTASPTATDTATLTHTPTATITATPTASHTPTATITPTPSITLTPSPDLTQTLIQATLVLQIQTATIAACDFDYAVVEQVPPDGEFYRSNSDYVREIRLLNTGNCPWERNTSLVFVDGEDFDAQRIWIRERVNPGDEVTLTFMGRTPPTGGVRAGTWELRTPGQILIGEPLVISISVFEG